MIKEIAVFGNDIGGPFHLRVRIADGEMVQLVIGSETAHEHIYFTPESAHAVAKTINAVAGQIRPTLDKTNGNEQKGVLEKRQLWREFGQAIRMLRKGAGLTMKDVADRVKVSVATISTLELGESK